MDTYQVCDGEKYYEFHEGNAQSGRQWWGD